MQKSRKKTRQFVVKALSNPLTLEKLCQRKIAIMHKQEIAQKRNFGNEKVLFLGLLKNTPCKSMIFGQELTSRKKVCQDGIRQKLGTILENKVVQKLTLEKN